MRLLEDIAVNDNGFEVIPAGLTLEMYEIGADGEEVATMDQGAELKDKLMNILSTYKIENPEGFMRTGDEMMSPTERIVGLIIDAIEEGNSDKIIRISGKLNEMEVDDDSLRDLAAVVRQIAVVAGNMLGEDIVNGLMMIAESAEKLLIKS